MLALSRSMSKTSMRRGECTRCIVLIESYGKKHMEPSRDGERMPWYIQNGSISETRCVILGMTYGLKNIWEKRSKMYCPCDDLSEHIYLYKDALLGIVYTPTPFHHRPQLNNILDDREQAILYLGFNIGTGTDDIEQYMVEVSVDDQLTRISHWR